MGDDVTQLVIETPLFVIKERVHKGATLLDNIEAGWAHRVNLDTLEGSCPTHGVLGQVFGVTTGHEDDEDNGSLYEALQRTGLLMSEEESNYWRAVDPSGYQIADHNATAMVNHGFFAQVREMREIPELMRTVYRFTTGKEAPERAPMPRDEDQVALEVSSLEECWSAEVRSRL
jgi:hypothetical protein